ncbi:ComEC/Rec2 family competence protein [Flagellimonas sp. CMM7]|uniref:ComEC/Rec2 family competence protein n=1 Tax=Flagellimonas sp. CMM7 TaxID=2654676 RepID=UPI0013D5FF3A|nr:ComEC/Rec2 family competence protein [Flagellimonas sp. CMM7]UII78265.1 ComEC family competence protein [Flagellimonas sp. CMM7]
MHFFNFVSIKLTLYLVIGIIIGFYFEINPQASFFTLLGLFPCLFWFNRKQSRNGPPFFELTTILVTLLLGVFIVNISESRKLPHHYSNKEINGVKQWGLKILEVLKPNHYTQRYVAKVITLENEKSTGKLVVNFPTDSTMSKLKVDDEFIVFSSAEAIKSPLNPHQFNYKDYLKKQGVYHQIRTGYDDIQLKENPKKTIFGLASKFREHIVSKLKNEAFGKDELAVIQALLLGKRDDISESTYNNYKNAGAVHILAVSGLHIGILLLLFQFLLSPLERLPNGKTLKLILIVLLLWTYAFIAGLSPSVVRAVTMFSFLAYAMHLNRPTNSFNIIALSMFFILLIKPLFLFQVGFQMSYAAVFAIVWIYPKLQRFWFPENMIIRKVWQLVAVSIAAQLGVLPISLFYFHQFPALFFISNLLIIPFLGLILGMGILVILLSIFNSLPNFMTDIYNVVIKTMNGTIDWVAKQEGFIIKDIPFDTVQMILGYLVILTLVMFLSKPKLKNTIVLLIGIITLQGWSIWNQIQVQKKETLVLLHKSKNTLLLHQKGTSLKFYASDSSTIGSLANDYKTSERIQSASYQTLKNNFNISGKNLYVMDSLGIYSLVKDQDYILLTQSPKVNLERVIDATNPKMVIADGSNYRSHVSRWKQTCLKKEIPFHSTGEKGYYSFRLNLDQ